MRQNCRLQSAHVRWRGEASGGSSGLLPPLMMLREEDASVPGSTLSVLGGVSRAIMVELVLHVHLQKEARA